MADLCERCGHTNPTPKNRFCGPCGKELRAEMTKVGYLKPVPPIGQAFRTADQKENVRDTKYGRDS
jgi:predicted amidophosphoribosyltransferase